MQENRRKVTIRIWPAKQENSKTGHATLETDQIYVSFCPKSHGMSFFKRVSEARHATLGEDMYIYNYKDPEIKIELYTLDIERIHDEYRRFREGEHQWDLLGSAFFNQKGNQNCSGLVFHLLKIGGLEKLLDLSLKNPRATSYAVGASAGAGAGFITVFTAIYAITGEVLRGGPALNTLLLELNPALFSLALPLIGLSIIGVGVAGVYTGTKLSSKYADAQNFPPLPEFSDFITGKLILTPGVLSQYVQVAKKLEENEFFSGGRNKPSI